MLMIWMLLISSSGSSDLGVSDIILPSTSSFMAEDDASSQVSLNHFPTIFNVTKLFVNWEHAWG